MIFEGRSTHGEGHEYRHAAGHPPPRGRRPGPDPGFSQAHPLGAAAAPPGARRPGSSARLRCQWRRIRDRRLGLCRPGHHRPSEQHQHRVRPPDPPPANRCPVQAVQPRPLPSLGRRPGDATAARRLQASRSKAAIRTSVNEDVSGTVAKAASPISSWITAEKPFNRSRMPWLIGLSPGLTSKPLKDLSSRG